MLNTPIKNRAILEDVIAKYHVKYIDNQYEHQKIQTDPNHYNVTYILEEAFCTIGGLELDKQGFNRDFTDGSDCKTGSISARPSKPDAWICNTYHGKIRVNTPPFEKEGALRCVIYNDAAVNHGTWQNRLMYYFIPKAIWEPRVYDDGWLKFSYNLENDTIKKFECCRMATFGALREMTEKEFWRSLSPLAA